MKVLQISHTIYPVSQAGTEIYTDDLARALIRQGVEVTVALPSTPLILAAQQKGQLPAFVRVIQRAPAGRFGNKLRYATGRGPLWQQGFRDLVQEIQPDLIHLQHGIGFGIELVPLLESFGLPIVITLPDYWLLCPGILRECNGDPERCADLCCTDLGWQGRTHLTRLAFAKKHRRIAHSFLKRVRPHLAAISSKTKSIFVTEGIDERTIELHPWGIEVKRLREAAAQNPRGSRPVRIGYLGSVRTHKGCHILAEAFVAANLPGATLEFFGGGDEAYIASLKQQFARPDILFHGRFDHSQVFEIVPALDIIVVPSLWEETYCLVAQEALAARKIVIASNIGGLTERMVDGVNGFLVPAGDISALTAKLQYIVPRIDELTAAMNFDLGLLDIDADVLHWKAVYESQLQTKPTAGA